jgi:hypothetical protein
MSKGDIVEARYRGGSKYYKGKIKRDNGDGTYDIDYDDGEQEKGVAQRLIQKISGGGGLKRSPRSPRGRGGDDSDDGQDFKRGDKVEAKYRGGSKACTWGAGGAHRLPRRKLTLSLSQTLARSPAATATARTTSTTTTGRKRRT